MLFGSGDGCISSWFLYALTGTPLLSIHPPPPPAVLSITGISGILLGLVPGIYVLPTGTCRNLGLSFR